MATQLTKAKMQKLSTLMEKYNGFEGPKGITGPEGIKYPKGWYVTKEQESILLDWRNSPSTWTGK